MAERPILFSAPMVRALLSGTKTQTRRIVKPADWFLQEYARFGAAELRADLPCKYGEAGDNLAELPGGLDAWPREFPEGAR